MSIAKVKIVLSSIGISAADGPRQVAYLPMAQISYKEEGLKQKTIFIGGAVVRKKYEDMLIDSDTFFAVLHDGEYEVFNEDGDSQGTVPFKEVGVAVEASNSKEYAFICLKDRMATFIGYKGEIVTQREFSDKEYKPFEATEQWRKTFYEKIVKAIEELSVEPATRATSAENAVPSKGRKIANKRKSLKENPDEWGVRYTKNGTQLIKCENKEIIECSILEGVTKVKSHAFLGCKKLKRIYVSSSVEKFSLYGLADCDNLERINVADDNKYYCSVDGVLFSKDMTELIYYPIAAPFTSYKIPKGVVVIGYSSFSGCLNLREVIIPDSVGCICDEAFYRCTNLTKVTMSNSDTHGWTNTFNFTTSLQDYSFSGCTSLKDVTISENIEKIKDNAFWGCTSLSKIFIPKSVTNIGVLAFLDCDSLEQIDVADDNEYYCSVDGVLYSKDKKKLVLYPCGAPLTSFNILEGTKKIGNCAFWGCQNLTKVLIPNTVTEIGEGSFQGCKNLKEVCIPDSVKKIGIDAFSLCESLESFIVPRKVKKILEGTFYGCKNLRKVVIQDWVTLVGTYIFDSCPKLENMGDIQKQ